ncbi:MAG: DUF488 domain-containing protein [Candidatus Aminicenantales bacterium]
MGRMNAQELFTVGYEGRDIDTFIGYLKTFNITRLIDVREIPISRKKGFSKSQLKSRVEAESIEYVHIKSLGSPSHIRHQLKEDHDYGRFFSSYSKYLEDNPDAITKAYEYVRDGVTCLMCFERIPEYCHRSAVAMKIKEHDGNGLRIVHV